ncbi:hypothetical protein N431DRAFT_475913 [Stipitochalara longipes BDJ]|nr:hypothetical protein N431DRAFT_475913 [Stipitochalara longipes BDJ]
MGLGTFLPEFDAEEHLVQHLSVGFFCSNDKHEQHFNEHCASLQEVNNDHEAREGLIDLQFRTDPTIARNSHIPKFLAKRYVYRGNLVSLQLVPPLKSAATPDLTIKANLIQPSNRQLPYEGRSSNNGLPRRLCVYNSEFVAADRAPSITPDIDSACGEVDSFGGFKSGWLFYPYATPVLEGKCHGARITQTRPEATG